MRCDMLDSCTLEMLNVPIRFCSTIQLLAAYGEVKGEILDRAKGGDDFRMRSFM